ncbi:unnamed protein product, partial [Schistosoma turkestanicum]
GANLLIDSTGTVIKISDFGASARLSGEQSVAGQFQGQVIGTFSFMAPEVLRGETYGRACDIWSVGCCLIEMLTSKPPWHDARLTNRFALMFTIATSNAPPTYPKDLSTDLITVLDDCFARNPSDRPTANQLLNYAVFARLIHQQQSMTTTTTLEENNSSIISSSVPTTTTTTTTNVNVVTEMYKNTGKSSLKSQLNSIKSNRKSSFNYQRLLKTFQSNKINSSVNHKKVIVVEEVENEHSEYHNNNNNNHGDDDADSFRNDSKVLTLAKQLTHSHQHSDKFSLKQQQQHNQYFDDDDSGLLVTRRRKPRRPTPLTGLNFHKKSRSHNTTRVNLSSFKLS